MTTVVQKASMASYVCIKETFERTVLLFNVFYNRINALDLASFCAKHSVFGAIFSAVMIKKEIIYMGAIKRISHSPPECDSRGFLTPWFLIVYHFSSLLSRSGGFLL